MRILPVGLANRSDELVAAAVDVDAANGMRTLLDLQLNQRAYLLCSPLLVRRFLIRDESRRH